MISLKIDCAIPRGSKDLRRLWNFDRITTMFNHENAFESVVQMVAILAQLQWVIYLARGRPSDAFTFTWLHD